MPTDEEDLLLDREEFEKKLKEHSDAIKTAEIGFENEKFSNLQKIATLVDDASTVEEVNQVFLEMIKYDLIESVKQKIFPLIPWMRENVWQVPNGNIMRFDFDKNEFTEWEKVGKVIK